VGKVSGFHFAVTPKEIAVFAKMGRRIFQTRRKKMSAGSAGPGMMMVNVDELMAEIGRMHVQVTQSQKQVHAANQQVTQLNAAIKKLTEDLQKQVDENKILAATNLTLIQENENILAGRPPLEPIPTTDATTKLSVMPSVADLDKIEGEKEIAEQTADPQPRRKRGWPPTDPQSA
jgi:hypothetical protein